MDNISTNNDFCTWKYFWEYYLQTSHFIKCPWFKGDTEPQYTFTTMLSSSKALTAYQSSRCDLWWTDFALNSMLNDTFEYWSIQQNDFLSWPESREVICVCREFYDSHVIDLVEWINIWTWIQTELSQGRVDHVMMSVVSISFRP